MKFPQFSRLALTLAVCFAAVSVVCGQDTTPPFVKKPIGDVTVSAGAAPTVLPLKKTFGLTGVTGQIVRFTTSVGTIDVELFADRTPQTVAAFLKGVNTAGDNTAGVATYTNTLIQRAVRGFIVQGGGFFVDASGSINQIVGRPAIPSEAGILNTPGTLAMALSTGPQSATGDFFFNVVSNTNLDDSSNGGPFTVFGRVVGVLPDPNRTVNLTTLDKIEALPQRNFSGDLGGGFENVPLLTATDGVASTANDLVYLNNIVPIALLPKKADAASILRLKIKNSNRNLLTAAAKGRNLILTYTPGATGTATIKVRATNRETGSMILTSFKVTVQ